MPLAWAFRSWVRNEAPTSSAFLVTHVELVATSVEYAGVASIPCIDIEPAHVDAIAQIAAGAVTVEKIHEIVETVAAYGAQRFVVDSSAGRSGKANRRDISSRVSNAAATASDVASDARAISAESSDSAESVKPATSTKAVKSVSQQSGTGVSAEVAVDVHEPALPQQKPQPDVPKLDGRETSRRRQEQRKLAVYRQKLAVEAKKLADERARLEAEKRRWSERVAHSAGFLNEVKAASATERPKATSTRSTESHEQAAAQLSHPEAPQPTKESGRERRATDRRSGRERRASASTSEKGRSRLGRRRGNHAQPDADEAAAHSDHVRAKAALEQAELMRRSRRARGWRNQ